MERLRILVFLVCIVSLKVNACPKTKTFSCIYLGKFHLLMSGKWGRKTK